MTSITKVLIPNKEWLVKKVNLRLEALVNKKKDTPLIKTEEVFYFPILMILNLNLVSLN